MPETQAAPRTIATLRDMKHAAEESLAALPNALASVTPRANLKSDINTLDAALAARYKKFEKAPPPKQLAAELLVIDPKEQRWARCPLDKSMRQHWKKITGYALPMSRIQMWIVPAGSYVTDMGGIQYPIDSPFGSTKINMEVK